MKDSKKILAFAMAIVMLFTSLVFSVSAKTEPADTQMPTAPTIAAPTTAPSAANSTDNWLDRLDLEEKLSTFWDWLCGVCTFFACVVLEPVHMALKYFFGIDYDTVFPAK